MAQIVTITELRSMQVADLAREVRGLRNDVAKMKISIKLGKQKDTGGYRGAKRQLARMLTVLSEKERGEEQKAPPQPVAATKPSKKLSSSKK
ncbi:MAG: 50S ribosomal protein L29 [Candidatus Peribacteraceae bacterium]|nr:50S ribosomal protein L29 [Candidatus Peribacteraceae bacterium]